MHAVATNMESRAICDGRQVVLRQLGRLRLAAAGARGGGAGAHAADGLVGEAHDVGEGRLHLRVDDELALANPQADRNVCRQEEEESRLRRIRRRRRRSVQPMLAIAHSTYEYGIEEQLVYVEGTSLSLVTEKTTLDLGEPIQITVVN